MSDCDEEEARGGNVVEVEVEDAVDVEMYVAVAVEEVTDGRLGGEPCISEVAP